MTCCRGNTYTDEGTETLRVADNSLIGSRPPVQPSPKIQQPVKPHHPDYILDQLESSGFTDASRHDFISAYNDVWNANEMLNEVLNQLNTQSKDKNEPDYLVTHAGGRDPLKRLQTISNGLLENGRTLFLQFIDKHMEVAPTEAAYILNGFCTTYNNVLRDNTVSGVTYKSLKHASRALVDQHIYDPKIYKVLSSGEWLAEMSESKTVDLQTLDKELHQRYKLMQTNNTCGNLKGPQNKLLAKSTIVLIGGTGSGKSQTGNLVSSSEMFKVGLGMKTVTSRIEKAYAKQQDDLVIIDTPVFPHDTTARDRVVFELAKIMSISSGRMPVFLCVVKNSLTDKRAFSQLDLIKDILGPVVLEQTIVCLTDINPLHKQKSMKQYLDELQNSPDARIQSVKDMVFDDLGGRVVRVDDGLKYAKMKECARDVILSAVADLPPRECKAPLEKDYIMDVESKLKEDILKAASGQNQYVMFQIGDNDIKKLHKMFEDIEMHHKRLAKEQSIELDHLKEVNEITLTALLKVMKMDKTLWAGRIDSLLEKSTGDIYTSLGEKERNVIIANNEKIVEYVMKTFESYKKLYSDIMSELKKLEIGICSEQLFIEGQDEYYSQVEIEGKIEQSFSKKYRELSEQAKRGSQTFAGDVVKGRKRRLVEIYHQYVQLIPEQRTLAH